MRAPLKWPMNVNAQKNLRKRERLKVNSLSGLARRPIAHCCSCTLELSSEYDSYSDFTTESKMTLSDQSAFIMNAM